MLGGDRNDDDIPKRIEMLHQKLKQDYTARWELDCYLLAMNHSPPREWMVLDISDTFHYHNLPDLMNVIRATLMGLCCSQWLQRIFNVFLCGKRYRRLVNTNNHECQLKSAVINTLHGLLLGLYPCNERRMDFSKRVWIAGVMHQKLTAASSSLEFITSHQNLVCLSLMEYVLNAVHDFCPVEWSLLCIPTSSRSQCLASIEQFRELSVNDAAGKESFWKTLDSEAQPIVASLTRFFRDTVLYQHRPRSVLQSQLVREHLSLALETRVVQNSSSVFGQLRSAHQGGLTFKQSEALDEIWTAIYMRHLPAQIAFDQMESLERIGSMCGLVDHELHHLPICMACALTRRADVLKTLFRFDPVDNVLVCNECSNLVVHFDMLGRILYVRDKSIVLCTKCLQPKLWERQCPCENEDRRHNPTCCVCDCANTTSSKEIVDLAHLRMSTVHFCYKHTLKCVINSATIYDSRTLEEELRNRSFKPVKWNADDRCS